MKLSIRGNPWRSSALQIPFSSLAMLLFMFGFAVTSSADGPRIISFDAPGADTNPNDALGTFASGINNLGAVTGAYIDVNDVYHGFVRSPDGHFVTFEAPGADTTPGSFNGTSPNAINDLGAVTGSYFDASGVGHGFLRFPDGRFTTFDVPGAGGYGSTPIAINLEGTIVGFYTNSNFVFRAFLRTLDGRFTTFAGPGACHTGTSTGCFGNEATNANVFGIVAGNYMDSNFVSHGMVRNPDGVIIRYDVPGAGSTVGSYQGTGCPGCFSGLNQLGAIAGIYSDSNSVNHGFLRSPDGKITTFDAPDAGTQSYQGTGCFSDCPVSLNDWGAIAGIYIDENYVFHGYLRSPDGNIVTIDPVGSTGTLPYGINDWGVVAGYYNDGNNVSHGFLRIPQ
jgi:hypothetical protein